MSVVAQTSHHRDHLPRGIKPVRLLGREGVIKGQKVTLDMNHIYSEHEKYVLLEVEMPAYEKEALNIADVKICYVDMKDNKEEKLNTKIAATTTRSRNVYDTQQNKVVYADVVEQIAIENNERAWPCGIKDRSKKPNKCCIENTAYLRSMLQR